MDKLDKVKRLAIKYGASDLKPSTRKDKKYMALYKGRWIHYGQKGYEDYHDHQDKERRKSYRTRARGIRNKEGQQTYKIKGSKNYFAYNTLW